MRNSVSQYKIIITETSLIIRLGVTQSLRRFLPGKTQLIEIANYDLLSESLRLYQPDIVIINPTLIGAVELQRIRSEVKTKVKVIALLYNVLDPESLKSYDETITIYDDLDKLKLKIERLLQIGMEDETTNEEVQQLSHREKEIIVCVVKGMSNKEIADELSISAHTVITHRKNITRKLQINSTAGLTIYAIVNKLVTLEEVNIS